MLASVIEIDDLHGAREVLVGQIPYPFGSVTHDNFLCRAAPATVPGFQIDALSKLFGSFDGSCISSRIRISNGIAFFIPGSLGEDAAQFDFAPVGRQFCLCVPPSLSLPPARRSRPFAHTEMGSACR